MPGHRAFLFGLRLIPAGLALALLLPLTFGALFALIAEGGIGDIGAILHDPYILRVTRFTLFQAVLSTFLSLLLALPLARALHRRNFKGKKFLLRLFGLTLVMPVIVAILGIVIVHGKTGWSNWLLSQFSIDGGHYLYGLSGIILAHVFFNMPLMARAFLNALENIPQESWRLASQFGLREGDIFRLIEWPALRAVMPGLASLVLMLCFTSFAIVLTLGGGPGATTIEVAIYQALRFDFDIGRAAALCLMQLLLCGTLAAFLLRLGHPGEIDNTEGRPCPRPDRNTQSARICDGLILLVALLIALPPLGAVFLRGMTPEGLEIFTKSALWLSVLTSLKIALASGLVALLTGLGLLATSRNLRLRYGLKGPGHALELGGSLILIFPPFVMATGLFLLMRDHFPVFTLGPYLVILTNAAMALPFIIRLIGPAYQQAGIRHDRLCQSLNLTGYRRFRLVDWPEMRRPAGLALAIAIAMSLGDLGVVALFGSQDFTTFPLYIYRLTGGYRLDEAASASLLLVLICFFIFWLVERFTRGHDA